VKVKGIVPQPLASFLSADCAWIDIVVCGCEPEFTAPEIEKLNGFSSESFVLKLIWPLLGPTVVASS